MQNEILFSYGTLQKPELQMELFGRIINGSPDILCKYKIGKIEIKDPEFVLKSGQQFHLVALPSASDADTISGIALEISAGELLMADTYEPEEYKRINVMLDSGREAWLYTSV